MNRLLDHRSRRHGIPCGTSACLVNSVDRDYRGNEPAVGIFQPHQIEHSLRPVLAGNTVERVENDIGLPASRSATSRSMSMRDLVPAAFESSAISLPLISDTSRSADQPPIRTATPGPRVTSSPHALYFPLQFHAALVLDAVADFFAERPISALVASPVLMRKLVCFANLRAADREAAASASSTSCHALCPRGFEGRSAGL